MTTLTSGTSASSRSQTSTTLFLPRTQPPTAPGWYWAKYYLFKDDEAPIPRQVYNAMDPLTDKRSLCVIVDQKRYELDDYIWYGPLPTVREASSQEASST